MGQPLLKNPLNSRNKIRLVLQKGPAIAGLFFVFGAALGAEPQRLSGATAQYFRDFAAAFAPLVIRHEKGRTNYRWGDKNRDCAGLVRYIFWEALQRHDERFFGVYPAMHAVYRPELADFRHVAASWSQANFTTPQLVARSRFLGRRFERSQLKTGDLVYFSSPELRIRHVMLVIRSAGEVYLVYHTGDARNELRIRTAADLMALSEPEWHPDPANPVFQGIYRPDFLN